MTFRSIMATADQTILSALGDTVSMVTDDGINLGNITGVFEFDYVDGAGVEGYRPIFTCRTSDLPEGCHDYRLTFDGKTYTVSVPKSDGSGMTALVLKEL
jgi:hypothetical protein